MGDSLLREITALKRRARGQVETALTGGRLIQQPCEVCNLPEVEPFHDDYTKPLQVRWVCAQHYERISYGIPSSLTLSARIQLIAQEGPQWTPLEIAKRLNANPETVSREMRRHRQRLRALSV